MELVRNQKYSVALDRMKELCAGATSAGAPDSQTATPQCRSQTSMGAINSGGAGGGGTPNPNLNGDLGHLSPALVEGKGVREVALSAEARRSPAERVAPRLAEAVYLEQQRRQILEGKLEFQKRKNENMVDEIMNLK